MPRPQSNCYLQIWDDRGDRTVQLTEVRYLIGGAEGCDIRLFSPTAHECNVIFVRIGNSYQVHDIDLKSSVGIKPRECYALQNYDRIFFAADAYAVYMRRSEQPPGGGVLALLPGPPSSFPSVEEDEPVYRKIRA
ncbi:MAG: hypothetical protein ACAF41_12415 [Leptolyngbya sp. BL-A-14]